MKKLLLAVIGITFTFTAYGYEQWIKDIILEFMRDGCAGSSECYFDAKVRVEKDEGINGIIYFSCHTGFAHLSRTTLGHENFGGCINRAVRGYIKALKKHNNDYWMPLQKELEYCESWGGYHSQFGCWKRFLKDDKGKYAFTSLNIEQIYCMAY